MDGKKTLALLMSGLLSLPWAVPAQSAEFCVNDAVTLQAALDTAGSNGENDTIRLVQGIYGGSFSFYAVEGYAITLLGGYGPGCGSRVIDPSNTALDGGGSVRPLLLSYELDFGCGDIVLEGITFRNGDSGTEYGGGLYANAYCPSDPGSAFTVNKCAFINNVSLRGGAAYLLSQSGAGTSRDITITGNTVTGNTGNDGYGGSTSPRRPTGARPRGISPSQRTPFQGTSVVKKLGLSAFTPIQRQRLREKLSSPKMGSLVIRAMGMQAVFMPVAPLAQG